LLLNTHSRGLRASDRETHSRKFFAKKVFFFFASKPKQN
jgi:hypothetical protein